MKFSGSCLCKGVKFSFTGKNKHFDACHCSMCRKWSGGPAMTVESAGNIVFEGEQNVSIYSSSEWAERAFCKKCGTNLFYRLKEKDFCNFMLGTIDGHEAFEFKVQIYVDAKPENYAFKNETVMMTEKEVLAAFGVTE